MESPQARPPPAQTRWSSEDTECEGAEPPTAPLPTASPPTESPPSSSSSSDPSSATCQQLPQSTGPAGRAQHYMLEHIRPSLFAEFELILLTFCTGIQDAISFPEYHCFASNQTGNTVFLMLAIVLPQLNGDAFVTPNIGAALGFFLAGAWLTGQLAHHVGARCRLWLVLCNALQTGLVLAAGVVQYRHGRAASGTEAVAAIALLAFASGSQVVQSRSLRMTEISTAMATAAWVDLIIDPHMFQANNRPRNRRICFLLALATGSLTGAAIYRFSSSAVAVFVSAGGKALVTLLYLFNSADRPKVDVECAAAWDRSAEVEQKGSR